MRLAVNDTALSRRMARSGRLDVDAVETSGPKVVDATAAFGDRPLWLHVPVWDWSLAHPDAWTQLDAGRRTREALTATAAPWLSLHVGFSAASVRFDDGMKPQGPPLSRDATLAAMRATARSTPIDATVPLLLENLDAQAGGAYDHVCDPAFLRELIEEADVGMLLDLAHAQVSAWRLGMPMDGYLRELPLDRVRQLHLSGPRARDGTLWDAHETLRGEDLALLDTVLARTEPWAATLEYGRDEDRLAEQLAVLRERLR